MATVRSPVAHGSDHRHVSPAAAGVRTSSRLRRRPGRARPASGRSSTTSDRDDAGHLLGRGSTSPATSSPSCWRPTKRYLAPTPPRWSTSTTPLPRSSTWSETLADGARRSSRHFGTNASYTARAVVATTPPRRPGRRGRQAPVHQPAPHPQHDGARSVVAPAVGMSTRSPSGRRPRSRTSSACSSRSPRDPGEQPPRRRAGRRRRLRRQAADQPQEILAVVLAKKTGRPIKVDRAAASTSSRPPRPRPDPGHRDRRDERRHDPGPQGRPARRHGRLPADHHPGHPLLGHSCSPGIYKMDAYDFTCPASCHDQTPTDAYRAPWRPEATIRHRGASSTSWRPTRHGPDGAAQKNWIKHESSPYDTIAGSHLRHTGNYEAATTARRALRVRRPAGRAERSSRVRRPGCSSASASRRSPDVRPRPRGPSARWGVRRGRLGTLHDPGPATGKIHRHLAARPGHETAWSQIASDIIGVPVDDIEVVRRHRSRAVRHGHLRLALAGRRRPGHQRWRASASSKARIIAAHQLSR